jgi:hypothetical protein
MWYWFGSQQLRNHSRYVVFAPWTLIQKCTSSLDWIQQSSEMVLLCLGKHPHKQKSVPSEPPTMIRSTFRWSISVSTNWSFKNNLEPPMMAKMGRAGFAHTFNEGNEQINAPIHKITWLFHNN